MAHAGRAHLDQHLAGTRANHLHVVADVELGVTNSVEYRSAHGAPPISGEFCSDPLKSRTGCSHGAQAMDGQAAQILADGALSPMADRMPSPGNPEIQQTL